MKIYIFGNNFCTLTSKIDWLEKGQRFGKEVRRLTYGRVVSIESRGKGRYGRIIGNVILGGGKNLNR
jgi:endonuclease YncB( thermonuclease family)